MTSSDRLLEIVDHLFAAAVGESTWGPALLRLAAVTGSRGAGVQYDHQVRADLEVAELCNLPDDPTPASLRTLFVKRVLGDAGNYLQPSTTALSRIETMIFHGSLD